MNTEPTAPEDGFAELLAAWDDALQGADVSDLAALELPPEHRPRLARDLTCLMALRHALRPAGAPPGPTADLPLDPQGARVGRFQICRELGHGAYGVVFLAYDPQLGRAVALKVPRPEALATPALRQRFLREARTAAGLDHPNLIPVFDAGEAGPVCFIASRYCPGPTLADWLRRRGEPVAPGEAARLVATLAEAIHHAHVRGVVHRDLKPANIILQMGNGEWGMKKAPPPLPPSRIPHSLFRRSPTSAWPKTLTPAKAR